MIKKLAPVFNDVNWLIEKLIAHPDELGKLKWDDSAEPDYFL